MKFDKLLKESQFHGGRRLAEGKCRWLWFIALLVLFGSAVTVICVTVRRFLGNPTYIVQLEEVATSMDFPSVLVCPEVLFRDDKVDRFLSKVKIPPNLNYTFVKSFIYSLAAYYSPDLKYRTHDLRLMEDLLAYNSLDVDTASRMLTSACESTLLRCRWQGEIMNCSSLFQMELTGAGYCCVFNGRSLKREIDISHNSTLRQKWYTGTFGHSSGLMVAINQSQKLNDVDLSYKWLALQSSQHFVESTINGSAMNPGLEHWVEFHSQSFQIAEDARTLSNSLKKCRMTDEPLEYFPLYNKQYCLVECEMAITLRRCGCVRLVHPRPKGVSYCSSHYLLCAKLSMVTTDSPACNCPPACDVAADFVKISDFNLLPNIKPVDTFYDGLHFKNVTVARIFIMTRKVRTNARWSYFTNTDLFSQLGGVFNVFFGCSILTLLEFSLLAYRGIISSIRKIQTKTKSQTNQESKKEFPVTSSKNKISKSVNRKNVHKKTYTHPNIETPSLKSDEN